MCVVRLEQIMYRRQGSVILEGIDWTIRAGQHWALLGANGSGKTTLLEIMTGYEWPTAGTVEVLGQRFGRCNLSGLRKTIGWVSSALVHRVPHRDPAVQVVASGLEASLGIYREITGPELDQVRLTLGRLRVGQIAHRPYGVLSQGEQQRVLIARALINRPALLILDEPCAGLDPAARDRFLGDLGHLAASEEAPTLILVTHHVEEIRPWIEHVALLKDGRALAFDAKQEVLTGPLLSEALDWPCLVEQQDGCFRLASRSE